ncbi:MAG: hypothetical protein HC772_09780 [Leptolyngbyaceae cyanobacterium CRU_2_3]|nr:hypothetical protein [Leptolyngbyaceae cyanobacterium CRU_2_3]
MGGKPGCLERIYDLLGQLGNAKFKPVSKHLQGTLAPVDSAAHALLTVLFTLHNRYSTRKFTSA